MAGVRPEREALPGTDLERMIAGLLSTCGDLAMSGTTPELMQLAVEIVRANEPCTANHLRSSLKRQGASTRAANETLLTMIRHGYVRRTWNGKLKLP